MPVGAIREQLLTHPNVVGASYVKGGYQVEFLRPVKHSMYRDTTYQITMDTMHEALVEAFIALAFMEDD